MARCTSAGAPMMTTRVDPLRSTTDDFMTCLHRTKRGVEQGV